jgi:nucleotide-binding universal stress UspA family protein
VLYVASKECSCSEEEDKQFEPVRVALGGTEKREFVTLHGDDISQAVVNEAERYPADLLILGVRRASAWAAHLTPKVAPQIIIAEPCL